MTSIPIDPEARSNERLQSMLFKSQDKDPLIVTDGVYVGKDSFVVITEICRMITEGLRWNKKARIVLEYDPQKEKMSITTLMESDERKTSEDRESY